MKTKAPDIKTIVNIHNFIIEIEGLKKLLRHSWLSDDRQEGVAEHTWRMALMAMVLHSQLEKPVDLAKVLKMILVHDLAEVYAGDYHAFRQVPGNKHQLELKSFKKLIKKLPQPVADELFSLWLEFEHRQTPEAQFAVALDKLEVLIQHNQANISTWETEEYDFNYYYAYDKVKYSPILTLFRDLILEQTHHKILEEVKT